MTPVRTESSNLVYRGTPAVRDLHCQRVIPGVIVSVWWFTAEEREAIAAGANLSLTIFTEPIPPVRLDIVPDQGVGEDAPEILERLDLLRRSGSPEPGPEVET